MVAEMRETPGIALQATQGVWESIKPVLKKASGITVVEAPIKLIEYPIPEMREMPEIALQATEGVWETDCRRCLK